MSSKQKTDTNQARHKSQVSSLGTNGAAPEPERTPKLMTSAANPFDDASDLEVEHATDGILAVRRFTKIPVGKPKKSWWFRVKPDLERVVRWVLTDELDSSAGLGGRKYVCTNAVAKQIESLVTPCSIHIFVNRQGTPGVWLIQTCTPDGRQADSWISQEQAATQARTKWTAIEWDPGTRAYLIAEAPTDLGKPDFPDYLPTLNDYLLLALGERGLIHSLSDPDHARVVENLLKVRR